MWTLEFRQHGSALSCSFVPPQLTWEIRNSEPGGFTCELPLGMTQVSGASFPRDGIVPYVHDWFLYRGSNLHGSGIVTSINLNEDRDTLLVEGKDWLDYLNQRVYPFDPEAYVTEGDWASWPKQWGTGLTTGVDLRDIVEDILDAMINAEIIVDGNPFSARDFTPPFILANPLTGQDGRYKILPGDQTSIFDHIKKIAENSDGFEFDVLPQNLQFRMYPGGRDTGYPTYNFTKDEHLQGLDWTNEGPLATVTYVYGSGSAIKRGVVRTYIPSVQRYRWTERVAEVGNVASQVALQKAASGEQFEDRFPRKRASWRIFDPETITPNFWTGGRPRGVIGDRVRCTHDFGFHKVDAYYRVMAITTNVIDSNEMIDFEVEMINSPEENEAFGGGGGGFEPA